MQNALSSIQHRKADGKRTLSKLELREERAAYIFLLPWMLGLIFLLGGPAIASILISFTRWNFSTPPVWIGLENYQRMFFEDPDFYRSMSVTLRYTLMSVPVYMVSGLGLAVLLNRKLKGMNIFRTVMFMPSVIAGTAVAVLWSMLLNPDVGVVNQVLRFCGIANPPRWLSSNDWAIPAFVLMGLWSIGGSVIIYLAGLQNIPPHLYEAAEIDGANNMQKFFFITLPLLTPTIFFSLITSLIGSFQVFDGAYVLNGRGARRGALLFYLLHLYNEGFRGARFGYASAMAWVLVILAAGAIVVTFRSSERWVYYETDSGR
jgi:multiple sugar transport system permease protein